MKNLLILIISSTIFCACTTQKEDKIQLAVQAWAYNKFSLEETAKIVSKIGFKYIEIYPGQKLKQGQAATTIYKNSEEDRAVMRDILKDAGIIFAQYGVVVIDNKADWIQLFDFAKAFNLRTINAEPAFADIPLLDSLTKAYNIRLAIHNHAIGTHYWNPDTLLMRIKGTNSLVGICGDDGHWIRSGLDPVACLKKVEDRLITMHLKDMNEFNNLNAHTVPFGTGVLKADEMIAELKRQNFEGVLTVEYEHNWDNPTPDITASFNYLKGRLN